MGRKKNSHVIKSAINRSGRKHYKATEKCSLDEVGEVMKK